MGMALSTIMESIALGAIGTLAIVIALRIDSSPTSSKYMSIVAAVIAYAVMIVSLLIAIIAE